MKDTSQILDEKYLYSKNTHTSTVHPTPKARASVHLWLWAITLWFQFLGWFILTNVTYFSHSFFGNKT